MTNNFFKNSSFITHHSSFIKIAVVVMLFLTLDIGYFVDRQDFTHFFMAYSSLFAVYFWVLKTVKRDDDFSFWLKTALILRGCLIFAMPNFSDDIYRFIWDGRLINMGINPFDFKPVYYFENKLYTDVLTPELYQFLNSKNYHTVYPSVCQAFFSFAVYVFPKSIYGATLIIKTLVCLCDIGSIFLIRKLLMYGHDGALDGRFNGRLKSPAIDAQHALLKTQNPKLKTLLYALNPLIIIELCQNIHFEGVAIFFFLLTIFLIQKNKIVFSSIAFSLSIATKILPLMFLPFFLKNLGLRKAIGYYLMVGIFTLLIFLPLYNATFLPNLKSSLDLYTKKFEFNASIYYLVREVGFWIKGYNWGQFTTPYLNGLVVLSIVFLFLKQKKYETFSIESFFINCLFAYSIYCLLAATVHPWYASFALLFSVFTKFRYPSVWTYFIGLTYIHYAYGIYLENYWVIALEYLVVIGFAVLEFKSKAIFLIKPLP
jgi:alpha-1,6-mannosyltransferase